MNTFKVELVYELNSIAGRSSIVYLIDAKDDIDAIWMARQKLHRANSTHVYGAISNNLKYEFWISVSCPEINSIQGVPFVRYSGFNINSKFNGK